MKRDPSIHIKLSDLVKVLTKYNINNKVGKAQAEYLLELCAPYSTSTRNVISSSERVEKKAKKLLHSSRLDSDLFSKLVYAVRRRLKHRGIAQIKPGSRDWDILKDVTTQALDFCSDFNLPKRKGFIIYIELGIARMNTYNLAKFPNLYSDICESYHAKMEIEKDEEPRVTDYMYKLYSKAILNQTGLFEDFSKDYSKYVYFVRARQQAKELNIDLSVYIDAQFEALDFAKGIPYPSQLVGPKSTERIYKYLFKRGLKLDTNRGK